MSGTLLSETKVTLQPTMSLVDAIGKRRSVRNYSKQLVSREAIDALLHFAVRAPTAVHEEPWIFAVLQDRSVLKRLSDSAKAVMTDVERAIHVPGRVMSPLFVAPDDLFYGAPLLIIIGARPLGPFVVADCSLAAENLMLAACAMGLGTCVSGLAVTPLNTPEWKRELGIPEDVTVIAALMVGVPGADTPETSRKAPFIIGR